MRVMIDEGAYAPTRAHTDDAGLDLYIKELTRLPPRSTVKVDTGVHVEIPKGYCGVVTGRSSLNADGILCSQGIIDSGYTGAICVVLHNLNDGEVMLSEKNRIAQMLIVPCPTPTVEIVSRLDQTERGNGGFGSTGA